MPHHLTRTKLPTPVGDVTLVLDGDTVLICEFSDRNERVTRQFAQYYPDAAVTEGVCPSDVENAITAYFAGDRDALDAIKTNPVGTEFEQRVWADLRGIAAGTTDSYGAMARRLNSSARAVGRANGRNPIGLIHPCHRVIGADGSLTGYAGGLDRKEWLLRHEGAILNLV